MEPETVDPIDILAFTTDELQENYNDVTEISEKATVINSFLSRWDSDSSLETIKNLKIEFEKDLDWFNVTEPLNLEVLHGKLVILDFFTYCCINCMHVLPELHELELRYPPESGVVILGVHSPKFENEKDAANILSATQRYGIEHPIVNDPHSTLWRALGIRCWPTLLVLSPVGSPLILLMGEGHGEFLGFFIEQALQFFTSKNEISLAPLPLRPSVDLMPASNLRFPAKVTRSEDGRYGIADAGNNRILIVDKEGLVLYRIGGNEVGFVDGDFMQARFNSPQGLVFFNNDILIVADTKNHAIRQITLSMCLVNTLVGTGQQDTIDRLGGKLGVLQNISSPWDVEIYRTRDMDMSFHLDEQNIVEKPIILVSMAGTHQIWGYFPEGMIWWKFRKFEPCTCVALIGNGLEENRNNSYPQNAAFAQPSGLTMAKNSLFIADSESSSIRKVSMVDGKVTAVVGGDRNPLNLFAFGDVDGKQYNAKLQHPLGVCYNPFNGRVYAADTYNHKIKVIDTAINLIETVPIKDEFGVIYQFDEPSSLCFDKTGQFMLVCDTNNHNIRIVNMWNLKSKIFNLNFGQQQDVSESSETDYSDHDGVEIFKHLPLHSYRHIRLRVSLTLGDDLKFTPEAPQKWRLNFLNSSLTSAEKSGPITNGVFLLEVHRFNDIIPSSDKDIKLDISLNLCDANSCLIKRFYLTLTDPAKENAKIVEAVIEENITIHITQNDINIL